MITALVTGMDAQPLVRLSLATLASLTPQESFPTACLSVETESGIRLLESNAMIMTEMMGTAAPVHVR